MFKRKKKKLEFWEWLEYGIENGYCTQQFCQMHDPWPITDAEELELSNGYDPCVHVVRLGSPEDWMNEIREDLLFQEED